MSFQLPKLERKVLVPLEVNLKTNSQHLLELQRLKNHSHSLVRNQSLMLKDNHEEERIQKPSIVLSQSIQDTDKDEQIALLQKELEEIQAEFQSNETKLKKSKEKVSKMEQQKIDLQAEIDEWKSQETQEDYEQQQTELLVHELESFRNKLKNTQGEEAQLAQQVIQQKQTNEIQSQHVHSLEQTNIQLQQKIEAQNSNLEALFQQVSQLTQTLSSKKKANEALSQTLASIFLYLESQASVEQQTTVLSALQEELNTSSKSKEEFQEKVQALTLEIEANRSAVSNKQQNFDELMRMGFDLAMLQNNIDKIKKSDQHIQVQNQIKQLDKSEKSMTQQITCQFCKQQLQKPQTLIPCGHSFCLKCKIGYQNGYCYVCGPQAKIDTIFDNDLLDDIQNLNNIVKGTKKYLEDIIKQINNLQTSQNS